MIAWSAVEDAIHAWAVAGTGLAADRVVWAQQGAPVPAKPYVTLRPIAVEAVGRAWSTIEDDGADFVERARVPRILTLSVQCFAAAATQSQNAVAILEALSARSKLPGVRAHLEAGGAAVAQVGPIASLDAAVNAAVFEPRARTDIRLHLTSEVDEVGTYIETVEVTNEITDDLLVIDLP